MLSSASWKALSPGLTESNERESYTPFVRISNSYNRTLTLKYEVGFCRWICLNGVIFGQKGVSFSISHDEMITPKDIQRWIELAKKNIGEIGDLWTAFENKLKKLKEIEMPEVMAVPMYMKVFDVNIDKNSLKNWKPLDDKISRIRQLAKEYFSDLGDNAYAMFNVLTDFASFPDGENSQNNLIPGYQRRVGKWADDIIEAYSNGNFKITTYIGTDIVSSLIFFDKFLKVMGNGEK